MSHKNKIYDDLDPGKHVYKVPDFGFTDDLLHQELNNNSLWVIFSDYIRHNRKYERLYNLVQIKLVAN